MKEDCFAELISLAPFLQFKRDDVWQCGETHTTNDNESEATQLESDKSISSVIHQLALTS